MNTTGVGTVASYVKWHPTRMVRSRNVDIMPIFYSKEGKMWFFKASVARKQIALYANPLGPQQVLPLAKVTFKSDTLGMCYLGMVNTKRPN
jgi:hypothetical protein